MATSSAARVFLWKTSTSQFRHQIYKCSSILSSSWSPSSSSSLQKRRWQSSYPSHEVVGMPSLSPTMEAGSIAKWNKGEGEEFAAGDILCEVETDKATVDFEAQDEGIVAKILAEAGPAEIKCGEPILIVVEDANDVDAFKDYVVTSTPAPAEPEPTPPPPAAPAAAPPTPVAVPPPTPAAPPPAVPVAAPPAPAAGGRIIASPLAHTLAKEMGLSEHLVNIVGTGLDGRIIAADVREYVPTAATTTTTAEAAAAASPAAAMAAATAAAPPPIPGLGYTDYPLAPAAMEIAAQLTHAKQNVPHYYLTVDITMDKLLDLRSTLNQTLTIDPDDNDDYMGISANDLIIKAAACAMKAVPSANASWMETSVRVYDSVDINVVLGNGDGLYSPIVRNVHGRGVKSISQEIASYVSILAEEQGGAIATTTTNKEEFTSLGTFTIMNLGMYGIKSCAPIIREPQAVCLALGAIENRIVPNDIDADDDDDSIYKQCAMVTATLSCDHRVVDGAVGAQWLSAFKAHVENPLTLLL